MAGGLKIRNSTDTAWITLGGSGGVIQQATEPTTPHAGMLWHDTDAVYIGAYKIVDNDGDTYVDVEGTGDQDVVTVRCGGTDIAVIQNASPHFKVTGTNPLSILKMNNDANAGEFRLQDATGDRSAFGQYGRSHATTPNIGYIYEYKTAKHMINWNEDGEVTKPNQPSATVYMNSNFLITATGSDTRVYFDLEVHDNNSDYSTATETFTAPVDGYYLITANLCLIDLDTAAFYYRPGIRTANQDFWGPRIKPNVFAADDDYFPLNHTVIAWMDANDTAWVTIRQQSGTASQTSIETVGVYASYQLLS